MELFEPPKDVEGRLALLERKFDERLQPAVDRAVLEIESSRQFEEHVVMPTLLLLAGFGHRERLDQQLAELEIALSVLQELPDLQAREIRRVRLWRTALEKMPVWNGYPVSDYYEPGPRED